MVIYYLTNLASYIILVSKSQLVFGHRSHAVYYYCNQHCPYTACTGVKMNKNWVPELTD